MKAMDHGQGPVPKKGWTTKNILLGLAFLFVGFVIWFLVSVAVGTANGLSGQHAPLGFWGEIGFLLMAFGVLGYWIAIPAYQKWRHTKRSLALAFVVPSIIVGLIIFVSVLGK